MTDQKNWLLLTEDSVRKAYQIVKPHVHRTPVLTSKTLNRIASTPQTDEALVGTPYEGWTPAKPKINFFFKCENYQRIGAFKIRGAFHAIRRLLDERGEEDVRKRGVITHSSGNHAQALSLAAQTFNIPAFVIMPSISTPSKIAATKSYGSTVVFSGSTSDEREAAVAKVQNETGAILVPPYDHPDIILGQGTTGLELEEQVKELTKGDPTLSVHPGRSDDGDDDDGGGGGVTLDAVVTPIGGGGLHSGVATYFSERRTCVFGAEPSFQGGDDCRRGLAAGSRIPTVKTLTIADGLRTPVGEIPWTVISDKRKVRGVFGVSEEQIKGAMRLVLERMKVFVEPSAVVGLAVCLYDEEFRRIVEKDGGDEGWDVGVVFSGGNTTVEAIASLYGGSSN